MSKLPQQYADLEKMADLVAGKAKFPLNNFGDLASALGGENAEFEYEGKRQNLGQVRNAIPDGFFPVASREDLLVKIAYVQTRHRKPADDHTPGEQKQEPKPGAGPPPPSHDIGKARPGGLPALAGIKQDHPKDKP
jgi:hypothetical protein